MATSRDLMGLGMAWQLAKLLGDDAAQRPTTSQLMNVGVPPFLADALGDRVIIQNATPAILAQLGMPASHASAVNLGPVPLSISGTPGSYTAGTAGTFAPLVSGGSQPYSYSLSGSLPGGWSFSGGVVQIPSSATAGTVSGLSITVTDALGATATLSFSIVVQSNGSIVTRASITQIEANGWAAQDSAPPLAFDPVGSPQYVVAVRNGYSNTGAATQYTDNLILTQRVRVPYNSAISTSTADYYNANVAAKGLLSANRVALSDFIYSSDTIAGVTNNSTQASPAPIAHWVRHDCRLVGGSMPKEYFEISAFHRNARKGEQVAFVQWTITDKNGASVTASSSKSVVSGHAWDANAVIVYRPAADVDVSSLADGRLTVNAKVYPWIGTAIADSSTGTLNAMDGTFCPQVFAKNVTLAASPPIAYVDAATGNNSTGVVSTTAATAKAKPFADIANAIYAIRAAVGIEVGGARVRLLAGTQVTGSATFNTYNTTDCPIIVEADPSATPATPTAASPCIWNVAASYSLPGTRALVTGITIQWATNVQLSVGSTADKLTMEQVWYTGLTGTSTLFPGNRNTRVLGMRFGGGSTYAGFGTFNRGVSGLAGNSAPLVSPFFVGCSYSGGITPTLGNNYVFAFSKMPSTPGTYIGIDNAAFGVAIVQNVFEYIGSTANPGFRPSSDGGTNSITNLIVHNNTFVGAYNAGRANSLYDETVGTLRSHTLCSFKGNIHTQINNKGDVFVGVNKASSEAPQHVGNWPYMYGVGCAGEVSCWIDAGNAPNGTGNSFSQAYMGLGSIASQALASPIDPKFANPQGVTYNTGTQVYTAGAGNGDYSLLAGSPVAGLLADPVLSFDLPGNARKTANDNAGAIRGAA